MKGHNRKIWVYTQNTSITIALRLITKWTEVACSMEGIQGRKIRVSCVVDTSCATS
jgi:hypothetical protein